MQAHSLSNIMSVCAIFVLIALACSCQAADLTTASSVPAGLPFGYQGLPLQYNIPRFHGLPFGYNLHGFNNDVQRFPAGYNGNFAGAGLHGYPRLHGYNGVGLNNYNGGGLNNYNGVGLNNYNGVGLNNYNGYAFPSTNVEELKHLDALEKQKALELGLANKRASALDFKQFDDISTKHTSEFQRSRGVEVSNKQLAANKVKIHDKQAVSKVNSLESKLLRASASLLFK